MTRLIVYAIFMAIGLMVIGCASLGSDQSNAHLTPEMSVPGPAKLDKKGDIEINGKSFQAGSEVALLFTTEDGVQSDIGYALEPVPVPDNQGDWLPASKIVHVQKDAWYGSRSVDFQGTDDLKETLPVVFGLAPDAANLLLDRFANGQSRILARDEVHEEWQASLVA